MSENERIAGRDFWRKCNVCKKEIGFGGVYYKCSVSTCNRRGQEMAFCTTMCYDGHLGFARHRSSYCEEESVPGRTL